MPNMDWWDFYMLVKANPTLPSFGIILALPLITVTNDGIEQFKKFISNGDEFLFKPFTVEELNDVINKMLSKNSSNDR